ncbi:VOC family protein [Virgibacillus sp. C22-A2]|uniref:VOC family protein n=1 Tax=Virgibacillus tibetensis TaxID=3042313 RepID=A0ABU6KH84_9BACI|nr:VOC family protein [Virgibacillus sp. C22-A2]
MLAIDHIIITAKDPEKAAKDFSEKNDVPIVQGGRHENWGTYNYLAYFSSESYIEWIGIFDDTIANTSDNPLIKQVVNALTNGKEEVIQFAFRTDRMDKYIAYFAKENIPCTGPFSGSRKKPDGSMLKWRMLFPDTERMLPFLVEWGEVKNVPEEGKLISDQHIDQINFGTEDVNSFKRIFQGEFHDGMIQLENGKIKLIDSGKPSFIIGSNTI